MASLEDLQNNITTIFNKIEEAESIEELKLIQKQYPYLEKFPEEKYPKLDISLTKKEIKILEKEGLLDSNGVIPKNLAKNSPLSPLEKLLYSILWKNGDLGKEKHVIEGVIGRDNKKDSLVFYYFGRHLANKSNPIIDQHVIRAWLSFKASKGKYQNFEEILNKTSVNAKDKKECEEYIAWQNKHKLKKIKPIEFTSYVDKLLFTLGKYLKNANIKRQKI